MDIVVNAGLLTVATVFLAFFFNQVATRLGWKLSELARKLIVFVVATAVTGYSAYQGGLPLPPADDPMQLAVFLLSITTSVFKVAQVTYDKLLKDVFEA
jgi:MFS-type transporter involved in bile tolerance (Atg22 family)